jgi:hypothetical protein
MTSKSPDQQYLKPFDIPGLPLARETSKKFTVPPEFIEEIFGKELSKQVEMGYLQDDILPFIPFLKKIEPRIRKERIIKTEINQNRHITFPHDVNVKIDKDQAIFLKLAFSLLSRPENIRNLPPYAFYSANTVITIEKDYSRIERSVSNGSDTVRIDQKRCETLTDAQHRLACKLGLFSMKKSQPSFGINALDNLMFINFEKSFNFDNDTRIFLFGSNELRKVKFLEQILKKTLDIYRETVRKIRFLSDDKTKDFLKLDQEFRMKSGELFSIEHALDDLSLIAPARESIDDLERTLSMERAAIEQEYVISRNMNRGSKQEDEESEKERALRLRSGFGKKRRIEIVIEEKTNEEDDLRKEIRSKKREREDIKKESALLPLKLQEARECLCGNPITDPDRETAFKKSICPLCNKPLLDPKVKFQKIQHNNEKMRRLDGEIIEWESKVREIDVLLNVYKDSLKRVSEELDKETAVETSIIPNEQKTEAQELFSRHQEVIRKQERIRLFKRNKERMSPLKEEVKNLQERRDRCKEELEILHQQVSDAIELTVRLLTRLKEIQADIDEKFKKEIGIIDQKFILTFNAILESFPGSKISLELGKRLNGCYDPDTVIQICHAQDRISLKFVLFMTLVELAIAESFSIPNLFVTYGLPVQFLERIRSRLEKLTQTYGNQFQIIFLVRESLENVDLPSDWK